MQNTTTIAVSRLVAQTRAMDVTATNLANANTPGYRAERMLFSDFLVRQPGGVPSGDRTLAYTQDRATYREQNSGPMARTANPLDLALGSQGFFTVQTPSGPRLTRSGHFEVSSTGSIIDVNGNALLDSAGQPLQVAPADTAITVAADGTISSQNGQIGRIGVVQPEDVNRMRVEGGRLLIADSNTTPVSVPKVIQGVIEESNVQPTMEITRMMNDLREFQFTTQFVQSEADRQQSSIDKITQRRS